MKYKFFLTSLVVAGLVQPAVAETFPADGYMQEDKTYENAATYTNTGVYDGSVTATAEYTDNIYNILAGTYLPAGAEVAETCEAGSFCPGKTDATYDESAPQGIAACPDGYPNSAAGASAQTQCYTACTLTTANIAHATGVSGNDYYGDGTDTCAATDCDPGYHVEGGELKIIEKEPLIPVDYTNLADGYAFLNGNGTGIPDGFLENNESFGAGLTEPNTWALHYDSSIVYGRASCQPNMGTFEYYNNSYAAILAGTMTYEELESGLTERIGASKAKFIVNFTRDMDTTGEQPSEDIVDAVYNILASDLNISSNSTGQYCYCQITGYTPIGGSYSSVVGLPWVFFYDHGSTTSCASECGPICGNILSTSGNSMMRAAILDIYEVVETGGVCAANEIKINWSDAEEIGDAGMCKYGGDIKTPVKAVTKKGKTFKGWRFEKAN